MIDNVDGAFALRRADFGDDQPVFAGVQAQGRLDGVLFALTLRQTYCNHGPRNMEVVYTFPLPPGAALLGFAAELDGRRLDGRILPRGQAERGDEEALAAGDAPMLLALGEGGLHTANLGNLLPGESIVLELRTAQLLSFDHGRLRLAIPTTIAPRQGNPDQGGPLTHQAPQASLTADYPLSLSVVVSGSLAKAAIDCPTHAYRLTPGTDGMTVSLAPGASLDRCVVFTVTPKESMPNLLVHAQDEIGAREGAGLVMLAAFEAPAAPARDCARLKLLLDCSGSMEGDSIASARRALHGVVSDLSPDDLVSFSRFGSTIEPVRPLRAIRQHGVQSLRHQIDATDATLGGTEMAAALLALIKDGGGECGADVLLITDGEVWDTRAVLDAARRSGHRIFAIGVGSAPAEDLLRELTQATGGAWEFAAPGEALERAARRMMARIRQGAWGRLQVDWGTAPRWQAALPAAVSVGSTVLVMAGFEAGAKRPTTARLIGRTTDEPDGQDRELACASLQVASQGDTLARMAAAQRLSGLKPEEVESLAMAYGLLSRQTHCVLVHRRDADDRPGEEAELHRVQSMLAAGWGGCASVTLAGRYSSQRSTWLDLHSVVEQLNARPSMVRYATRLLDLAILLEQPRAASHAASGVQQFLGHITEVVTAHLAQGKPLQALSVQWPRFDPDRAVTDAMAELQMLVTDPATAWLLLGLWVASRKGEDGNVYFAAVLEPHARRIDRGTRDRVNALLTLRLDGLAAIDRVDSRRQRWKRNLRST